MRSILVFLLLALPWAALADHEQAVMYATCDCEITLTSGEILDARSQLGFLPGPIPMEASAFSAKGEYRLDQKGSIGTFHNSMNDKYCGYNESGELNVSCLYAVAMAERRAQGSCHRQAKRQEDDATGMIIPSSCRFQLEGEGRLSAQVRP